MSGKLIELREVAALISEGATISFGAIQTPSQPRRSCAFCAIRSILRESS